MASLTTVVKVLLPVPLSRCHSWDLGLVDKSWTYNGTLALVEHVSTVGTKVLPGTHEATFTGVRAMDDRLKILVTFFGQS
jgi:hypothetical protein